VLGGIIGSFLPGVLGSASQGIGSQLQGQQRRSPVYPQDTAQSYQEQPNDPLGSIGSILGALGGLSGQSDHSSQERGGGSSGGSFI
jgi:hypothetical protein